MKKSFTLIELVVVIGLFALLATMTTAMLAATLQGAKKAAAVGLVKNEGSYVINLMTQMLKFSPNITVCGANSVTFVPGAGGGSATMSCVTAGTDKYIASGSARLTSDKVAWTACAIACVPNDPLTAKRIDVSFDLQRANAAFAAEKATAHFETQITLRNRE